MRIKCMVLCVHVGYYAISVKLSPEKSSSGIKCLEASNFKICCFQTLTGNQMHENSVGLSSTYNITLIPKPKG